VFSSHYSKIRNQSPTSIDKILLEEEVVVVEEEPLAIVMIHGDI